MNDRAQGGTADNSQKSTIELMQHRRLLRDDEFGVDEVLNETSTDGEGIRVTARYYMQIFDYTRSSSKQREQQLNID